MRKAEPIEFEIVLRKRNQLTLPAEIVAQLDLKAGDRIILSMGQKDGTITMRPVRRSYAGALKSLYGTPEEATQYIADERRSWD